LDYRLLKNERLNISYGRNLSRGGEYEFITAKLSQVIIEISKKIADASALRLIGIDLFVLGNPEHVENKDQIIFIEYNASPDMENNFYYDVDYGQQLLLIYEKIFYKIIAPLLV
jgi:glutathione synthase/RimK-type ligase-like ATP-grasp enzyme